MGERASGCQAQKRRRSGFCGRTRKSNKQVAGQGPFARAGRGLGDVAARPAGCRGVQGAGDDGRGGCVCAVVPSLCQAQNLRATANQERGSVMREDGEQPREHAHSDDEAGTAGGGRGDGRWRTQRTGRMEEGRERGRRWDAADVPNHSLIQTPRATNRPPIALAKKHRTDRYDSLGKISFCTQRTGPQPAQMSGSSTARTASSSAAQTTAPPPRLQPDNGG